MAAELMVWMNGEQVGRWTQSRQSVDIFEYAPSWLLSAHARPLSISLPIPAGGGEIRGALVQNYFDNLLPDVPAIRERLQRKFRTPSTHTFDLLQAIGRDCVGAVQLLPPGEKPEGFDRLQSVPLSKAAVAQILAASTVSALPGQSQADEGLRISIAGAQEKTALLRIKRQWHLPKGATPTSHILKLPMGLVGGHKGMDMRSSVENEWLCAQLLRLMGFNTAHTEIGVFKDQKVLVVERFDRQWMDGGTWLARLPQEDFCQVFGLPSHRKYESDAGPGISQILQILDGSEQRVADRQHFLCSQFIFWLLGALDGHAKNFSLALLPGGRYRLTPLYDVLSFWPLIGEGPNQLSLHKARMAMAVRGKNAHYKVTEIQARHWKELVNKAGEPEAFDHMVALSRSMEACFESVREQLPENVPKHLYDAIYKGTREQIGRFNAGI